jgi:hypothetical protein
MQNLLLLFILLFSLTACGDSEEKAAQQAKLTQEVQEAKAQKDALLTELKAKEQALAKAREEAKAIKAKLLAQEQAKKEAFLEEESRKAQERKRAIENNTTNKKLSNVGIQVDKNKIIIDTNKTRDFFQKLGKTFENKIKKITQEIEKGVIDEQGAGIKIDETHINIDLNKTKDFLEQWGKKMQGFVKEFDGMAKEMDKSIKTIENK